MSLDKIFVRKQTNIAGASFDAVLSENHVDTSSITRNPIDTGVQITDHIRPEPKIVTISGLVTDTPLFSFAELSTNVVNNFNVFGTSNSSNRTRSEQAFEIFTQLKADEEPLTIQTKLKQYENMVISGIRTTTDIGTYNAPVLEITLEEIFVIPSETVDLPKEILKEETKKKESKISKGGDSEKPTPSADVGAGNSNKEVVNDEQLRSWAEQLVETGALVSDLVFGDDE